MLESEDGPNVGDSQLVKKGSRRNGRGVGQSVAGYDDEMYGHKKRHPVDYQMPFLTTLLTLQLISVKFLYFSSCL